MTEVILSPGRAFGPFLLGERLALGGMAEVWSAAGPTPDLGEGQLALKVMRPYLAEDPEFRAMFDDEVSISKRLRHENIVEVYSAHEIAGHLVQAMELIEGIDLRRVLARIRRRGWRFPVPLVLHVGRCVARALAYAHLKKSSRGQPMGIVHRDISPHNIMLAHDGRVKVLDFGIAKAAERVTKTRLGIIKGKTGYMAPEQVIAGELDHRTDIFSAGIVLWETFTSNRLFRADGDIETMEQIRSGTVPRLDAVRTDVPTEVADLIHAMLARDREMRPASMLEVERAFHRILLRGYEASEHGPEALRRWLEEVSRETRPQGTAILPAIEGADPAPDVTQPDVRLPKEPAPD